MWYIHIRIVKCGGGCVFCWVLSTSFSCVRILWGDTELCCNSAFTAHWKKIGFSQWRMPKVAAIFLLKLICEHILHVPVSGWVSHLSLGAEQQELSGLPEALGCSSGQNSPEPWAQCDGDHRALLSHGTAGLLPLGATDMQSQNIPSKKFFQCKVLCDLPGVFISW